VRRTGPRDGYEEFGSARVAVWRAVLWTAAVTACGRASTQKPAAHCCGRVLDARVQFEQNTLFDRTSQMTFEVFFHRRLSFDY
jgi:hypothetical protein